MRISLKWLQKYVEINISPEQLSERLTMVGFEVESIEKLGEQLTGFVVGDVLEVIKHPKADKLTICTVNVGKEILQIVCGAPNVMAGQKVPVGLIGSEVTKNQHDPEGKPFKLSQVKLRGVDSFGMICSGYELNMNDDKEGIMVLSADAIPGTPLAEYFGVDDVVFEIGITPNRPDGMSHIGIAREVAALMNQPLRFPRIELTESVRLASEHAVIKIEDPKNCPRYSARVLFNITVAQSPEWIQQLLRAVGIRPVNNIVDVTNYVLMECGHPLHAFDYDKIEQHQLRIKCAENGESFTTLDHTVRKLRSDTLMICDRQKSLAIAGVMGGENSEITQTTKNILIESAYFTPQSIRCTSKHFSLSTDASQRFERGADPEITRWAADRATQLIFELAGGDILQGVLDIYPNKIAPKIVSLRPKKVNELLGITIANKTISDLLHKFEIEMVELVKDIDDCDSIRFKIPTFRPDIEREIDLIEEVARAYGYDNINVETRSSIQFDDNAPVNNFQDELRHLVVGCGLSEAITNSMEELPTIPVLAEGVVKIANPLSKDMEVLRTNLVPSMLRIVKHNIYHGQKNIRMFEIGRIYQFKPGTEAPGNIKGFIEKDEILLCFSGNANPLSWDQKSRSIDLFDVKGEIITLCQKISLDNIKFIPYSNTDALTEYGLLIENNEKYIGRVSVLRKDVGLKFDVDQQVIFAQLDIEELEKNRTKVKRFKSLTKYPSVVRDLAVVVDQNVPIDRVLEVIRKAGGECLTLLQLFDIYSGDQVQKDKKSCAFELEFISEDHTLTQQEVETFMQNIIRNIESEFHASIRK